MKSKLFHSDIFMPKGMQEVVLKLQQKYFNNYSLSNHVKEYLDSYYNRSHSYNADLILNCLNSIKVSPKQAFEVLLVNDVKKYNNTKWHVEKYCIRVDYNEREDLIVVISPKINKHEINNVIITMWLNDKNDNHYTLNDSKYCSKKEWIELIQRGSN